MRKALVGGPGVDVLPAPNVMSIYYYYLSLARGTDTGHQGCHSLDLYTRHFLSVCAYFTGFH